MKKIELKENVLDTPLLKDKKITTLNKYTIESRPQNSSFIDFRKIKDTSGKQMNNAFARETEKTSYVPKKTPISFFSTIPLENEAKMGKMGKK